MCITYLLISPLRACSHIRPTPRNANLIATWPQLHPRAFVSRSTDLLHVSLVAPSSCFRRGSSACIATLEIDVGGILLTWPIQLHLLFFTSNEMGSIPVRTCSSALDILFGQKMCRILLRNCIGILPACAILLYSHLVIFQDSAAYIV